MKNRLIVRGALVTLLMLSSPLFGGSESKDMSIISKSERESVLTESTFVMPSAGALANSLKMIFHHIEWKDFIDTEQYRVGKTNEEKVLNLGIKGADLFFLAISENSEELTKVAKYTNLILNEIIIDRKSINTRSRKKSLKFLEKLIKRKKWQSVLKEITILKENINIDFDDRGKYHLSLLNDIGSWMEGYRLTVEALRSHYMPTETAILFQAPLVEYLLKELKRAKELNNFSKRDELIRLLTEIDKTLLGAKGYKLSKSDLDRVSKLFKEAGLL